MSLNDVVAQQIMGEIDTITKHIDEQISQVSVITGRAAALLNSTDDLGKRIAQSQIALLNSVEEVRTAHNVQLEAKTAAQIDIFMKYVKVRTETEKNAIEAAAQDAKELLLKELNAAVTNLIREKFKLQNSTLEISMGIFEGKSKDFDKAIQRESQKVKGATDDFVQKLESIQPFGVIGQAIAIMASGVASTFIVLTIQHLSK